jgi:hypothetical protein
MTAHVAVTLWRKIGRKTAVALRFSAQELRSAYPRAIKQTNPSIRGPALTATALVLSAEQANGPKVEGTFYPDPDRAREVDRTHLGRLQPRATIPVQVDATDPQRFCSTSAGRLPSACFKLIHYLLAGSGE